VGSGNAVIHSFDTSNGMRLRLVTGNRRSMRKRNTANFIQSLNALVTPNVIVKALLDFPKSRSTETLPGTLKKRRTVQNVRIEMPTRQRK
jgi:hypothetical protein